MYNQPSTLKGAAKYLKKPGMISLGGGLPSAEHFPIEHIEIKVPTPPHFSEEETQTTGSIAHAGKHDVREGKSVYGEDGMDIVDFGRLILTRGY